MLMWCGEWWDRVRRIVKRSARRMNARKLDRHDVELHEMIETDQRRADDAAVRRIVEILRREGYEVL